MIYEPATVSSITSGRKANRIVCERLDKPALSANHAGRNVNSVSTISLTISLRESLPNPIAADLAALSFSSSLTRSLVITCSTLLTHVIDERHVRHMCNNRNSMKNTKTERI
jgi:hypothetical protein